MSNVKAELNSIRDLLLKGGVQGLYFGMSPDGRPFVKCEQSLETGGQGNVTQIAHQKVGSSLSDCLNALADDLAVITPLHKPEPHPALKGGKIIQVPGAN